jgi:nicotinamide-nucleotide amidase
MPHSPISRDVHQIIHAFSAAGQTIATAESLTGGLLCAALTHVPGASAVVRGGVVAYATDIKRDVLDVDEQLLAVTGPVDPDVAAAMAQSACLILGADVGIATTGVAGPDEQDGKPVGTVFIAMASPERILQVVELALEGSREEIRVATTQKALELLAEYARIEL